MVIKLKTNPPSHHPTYQVGGVGGVWLTYCCQNVQVMTLWMIFIEKLLEPSAINPAASHYTAFYLHFWLNLQNIEMLMREWVTLGIFGHQHCPFLSSLNTEPLCMTVYGSKGCYDLTLSPIQSKNHTQNWVFRLRLICFGL